MAAPPRGLGGKWRLGRWWVVGTWQLTYTSCSKGVLEDTDRRHFEQWLGMHRHDFGEEDINRYHEELLGQVDYGSSAPEYVGVTSSGSWTGSSAEWSCVLCIQYQGIVFCGRRSCSKTANHDVLSSFGSA